MINLKSARAAANTRGLTCAIMWQGGSAMSGSAAGFHAVRMSRLHSGVVLMRSISPASWSTPWPEAKHNVWQKQQQQQQGQCKCMLCAKKC
jgi:hypothetical protein